MVVDDEEKLVVTAEDEFLLIHSLTSRHIRLLTLWLLIGIELSLFEDHLSLVLDLKEMNEWVVLGKHVDISAFHYFDFSHLKFRTKDPKLGDSQLRDKIKALMAILYDPFWTREKVEEAKIRLDD